MRMGTRIAIAIALILNCWSIASADSNTENIGPYDIIADALPAVPQKVIVAERRNAALDVLKLTRFKSKTLEIHEPGASFLKLHFSLFNIPKGVTIEVRSPDGRESYRYTRDGNEARTINRKGGDDGRSGFSAMSISGDTAIVEVLGKFGHINSLKNRVYIDHYMVGYPEDYLKAAGSSTVNTISRLDSTGSGFSKTQSICGIDERYPATCWEQSDPYEFDRSWPVARLLINGSKSCTAWRVGPENFLFTNNHCIATQEELESAEVWFNYQAIECTSYTLEDTVKVAADTLFATHRELDFTLFSVQNFPSIEPFGYLGLDVRDANLGERISIRQHGYGYRKQIAIESDMNACGLCEVDDLHVDRYAPDTDIGYFCDSAGGSSGSPVLAGSSGRAIALHHFGGCVNSGVKISLIWPEVSDFFDGQVPAGDDESTDSENSPPVAEFSYTCDATVCSFDAGASADTDGAISQYTWTLGDGATGSDVTVEHTYAEARDYRVMLTVVDDEGLSDSMAQTVTVESANQQPLAAFQVSCEGLSCTFDASLSSDADGNLTGYVWEYGDASSDTFDVPTANHTYPAAGDYTVLLQVTDDDGASATVDTLLTVSKPVLDNEAPQASFTFSCTELGCEFDASDSTDSDGTISTYSWTFGDGAGGSGMNVEHGYAETGSYIVVLTVIDNSGASSSAEQTVSVEPANQPPSAVFQISCDGLTCTLDASNSMDADGNIASYAWSFGDGTGGTFAVPTVRHTYPAAGQYPVQLLVTDDEGATAIAETLLTTSEPENELPQASFTFSCQELACDFDAGGSTDPDGVILSYRWEFGDSTAGSGERVSHAFGAQGTYEVRLTVSDDREASSSATRIVQVTITDASTISLSATAGKYRGDIWIDLEWSGAIGSTVDLYRNGGLLTSTGNDGKYRDSSFENRDKSIRYRVCEHDTATCSDEVLVLR